MDAVIRTDRDFAVEAWLALYHASGYNRGWTRRNAETMLVHAHLIVTAWLGEELVGTLTVLSDGLNYATIDDVVVLPAWRHQGIGSAIVRRALESLRGIDPQFIHLNAIPGVEEFYERLGFVRKNESPMFYGQ